MSFFHRALLHYAAAGGSISVCSLLLEKGASVNAKDVWGRYSLDEALLNDWLALGTRLFARGAEIMHGQSLAARLCRLAVHDDSDQLKKYLRYGAQKDARNSDGRTALHSAARYGSVGCAKTLLEFDANVNLADPLGTTPLLDAAKKNNVVVANLLATAGGKLGNCDQLLLEATAQGNGMMVNQLLQIGANPNLHNYDGRTPMHTAAAHGQLHNLATLLLHGAIASPRDSFGNKPLGDAAFHGHTEIMRYLIASGANADGDHRVSQEATELDHAPSLNDVRQQVAYLNEFSKQHISLYRASNARDGANFAFQRCMSLVQNLPEFGASLKRTESIIANLIKDDNPSSSARGVSKTLGGLLASWNVSSTVPTSVADAGRAKENSHDSKDLEGQCRVLNQVRGFHLGSASACDLGCWAEFAFSQCRRS